jgi:hypothetical protein
MSNIQAYEKTTKILSFDVGMRNLAFCTMSFTGSSVDSCTIHDWDIIDLGPNVRGVEKCARILTKMLNAKFGTVLQGKDQTEIPRPWFDYVLIERQPKHRSIIMVAIQMFLCEYFTVAQTHCATVGSVNFVSAKEKLKICEHAQSSPVEEAKCVMLTAKQAQRKRYSDNKKNAVTETKHFLEHNLKDYGNLVIFTDVFKKKDDLADALLQGVSFFKNLKSRS